MTSYRNPWAKDGQDQFFHTEIKPVEHAGCQLYHVFLNQWDVVKSGVCIAQRAGKIGAMQCAEVVDDLETPTFEDVRERMIEFFGRF